VSSATKNQKRIEIKMRKRRMKKKRRRKMMTSKEISQLISTICSTLPVRYLLVPLSELLRFRAQDPSSFRKLNHLRDRGRNKMTYLIKDR
jgi:hypothetical protein